MSTAAAFAAQLRRRYLPQVSDASIQKLANLVPYHAGEDPDRVLACNAMLAIVGEHTAIHAELWGEAEAIVSFAEGAVICLTAPGPGTIRERFHALALSLNVPGLQALGIGGEA